jgi:membrane protein implicated in regulation of membrane protease activity
MAENKSTQQNKSKGGLGLLAFLTGVAAGATALFLSKKENRDKTKQAVDQAVDKAKEVAEDVAEQSQKVKADAEKKVKEIAKKAKK